jgi:hypothetical protein
MQVTFPDGTVIAKALVLDRGEGVGIYTHRGWFPSGEDTRSPDIVRVALVEGFAVEPGGPGWTLDTGDGLIGLERVGGCGCGDALKRWRP